jgi:Bacterial Ig-like domain (group 3)/PQQ-like domain
MKSLNSIAALRHFMTITHTVGVYVLCLIGLISLVGISSSANAQSTVWQTSIYGPQNTPVGPVVGSGDPSFMLIDTEGNVITGGDIVLSSNSGSLGYQVVKIDAITGAVIWQYGTQIANQKIASIAIDGASNVYLTTYISTFDVSESRIIKLAAANGVPLWSVSLPSLSTRSMSKDFAGLLTLDALGNIYVITSFSSATEGDYSYISKLAGRTGEVIWRQPLKADRMSVVDLKVGNDGDVFLTGYSSDGNTWFDWETRKISATNGLTIWRKISDGWQNKDDFTVKLVIDANNDVIVVGSINQINSILANYDWKTIKYSGVNGSTIWERELRSDARGKDFVSDVAANPQSDIYVVGQIAVKPIISGLGLQPVTRVLKIIKYRSDSGLTDWETNFTTTSVTDDMHSVAATSDINGDLVIRATRTLSDVTETVIRRYSQINGALMWEVNLPKAKAPTSAIARYGNSIYVLSTTQENNSVASLNVTKIANPNPAQPSLLSVRTSLPEATYAAPIRLTATISSNTNAGTVTFKSNGVDIEGCVARTVVASSANCDPPFFAPGLYAITATYLGSNSSASISSQAITQWVKGAVQTISFPEITDKTLPSSSFVLSATATSSLPITYRASPQSVCTATGTNSATINLISVGQCLVIASQQGNNLWDAASTFRHFMITSPTIKFNGTTRLIAKKSSVVAGQNASLQAEVTGIRPSGLITFFDGTQAIAGCTDVPLVTLESRQSAIADCDVLLMNAGTKSITARYSGDANNVASSGAANVTALQNGPQDYSDMWWAGQIESGWGLSITQKGAVQFNAIYAYDKNGMARWYVMPGGTWDATFRKYTGALYQPTSSSFRNYNAEDFRAGATVGTATLEFTSSDSAKFTYTIDGIAGEKNIVRQPFGEPTTQKSATVGDLWWGGANSTQNGWGLTIAQQDRQLFGVLFTYESDGKTTWFVMPGGSLTGQIFLGDLYATTAGAWLGVPFNASTVKVTKVGTMQIEFSTQQSARLYYVVNGAGVSIPLTRQPF